MASPRNKKLMGVRVENTVTKRKSAVKILENSSLCGHSSHCVQHLFSLCKFCCIIVILIHGESCKIKNKIK